MSFVLWGFFSCWGLCVFWVFFVLRAAAGLLFWGWADRRLRPRSCPCLRAGAFVLDLIPVSRRKPEVRQILHLSQSSHGCRSNPARCATGPDSLRPSVEVPA